MRPLDEQTILITGATDGLGRAIIPGHRPVVLSAITRAGSG